MAAVNASLVWLAGALCVRLAAMRACKANQAASAAVATHVQPDKPGCASLMHLMHGWLLGSYGNAWLTATVSVP